MNAKLDQDLDAKVRFLSSPGALVTGETPQTRETHMSWVFLTKDLVFKLKKPVRHPYLDFSTRAARESACREELRINQQLAPGVYLRLARLTRRSDGAFELDGDAAAEDWLVVMRRLDHTSMLDSLLKAQTVTPAAISGLTDLLINFYRSAPPDSLTADAYVRRFRDQIEVDRETISIPRFRIDHARAGAIAERLNERLHALDGILRNRVAAGCIVEGHGDLRPEHVSLGDPIRVIDRLEFNRDLRLVDPFDELAFLGMECAVAGAEWIAPLMIRAASAALAPAPPTELIEFYTATRASLRARLSLAHLLDPVPREPQKWEPKAERYLDQAARALSLPRPAVR